MRRNYFTVVHGEPCAVNDERAKTREEDLPDGGADGPAASGEKDGHHNGVVFPVS